jgi:hypothetical protein
VCWQAEVGCICSQPAVILAFQDSHSHPRRAAPAHRLPLFYPLASYAMSPCCLHGAQSASTCPPGDPLSDTTYVINTALGAAKRGSYNQVCGKGG